MPKTQTLNDFTADTPQALVIASSIKDIIFTNIISSDITVTLVLDVGDGPAYVFKDLVMPGNTSLQIDNFQFQTAKGKLQASTNTTNGLTVIFTVT